MHRQFEELCALAATGQISAQALPVLDAHVKECVECRTFLQEMAAVGKQVGPALAASRARDLEPPLGIRERFLERAAAAGLSLHPGLSMVSAEVAIPRAASALEAPSRTPSLHPRASHGWASAFRMAIPVAAALACGVIGYFVARQERATPIAPVTTEARLAAPPAVSGDALAKRKIASLEAAGMEARQQIEAMSANLAGLAAEKRQLVAQLAQANQQAAAGQQSQQQLQAVSQQLQTDENQIASLQTELGTARREQDMAGAAMSEEKRVAAEANGKLADVQAQLAGMESQLVRERQLNTAYTSTKSMIAERDLHIVDIYDTTSKAQSRRPIGRVFYVEGRSLVFYAYDLPNEKRASAKIAFHVWGETAGVQGTTYNLGIMRADRAGDGRWKLAFNDPKVLDHINAVYLTAQPANKIKPQGKKLMFAFLGSPNLP